MLRSSQMRTTHMTFYFSLYNSIRKGSQKDSNSLLRLPVRTVVHPAISHCPGDPEFSLVGSHPSLLFYGQIILGKESWARNLGNN